jgi:hypothetical protein
MIGRLGAPFQDSERFSGIDRSFGDNPEQGRFGYMM